MEPQATHAELPGVELSDEELVRRILAGERELFELIVRRNNRKVFRVVRSILRDAAEVEDVMQQAYVSAYTALASFAGEASFRTWLLRIAMNEALGRLRRAKRMVLVETRSPETQEHVMSARDPNPEQACSNRELATLLEDAVDALPEMYRAVFMLRQVEGLSTADAAGVLGISEDAVKTRLHRARGLLHDRLAALAESHLPSSFSFGGARCDRVVSLVLQRIDELQSSR